jgi:hypothetical protein
MHTWDHDELPQLEYDYEPKLWVAEPPKQFNKFHDNSVLKRHMEDYRAYMQENLNPLVYAHPRLFSQWYSFDYSDRLRQAYEQKHGFKYDFVVKCRFDLEFLKPVEFSTNTKDKIYVGKWWGSHPYGMEDLFVVASSDNMTAVSRMYQRLYEYYIDPAFDNFIRGKGMGAFHFASPHELMYYHFQQENLLSKVDQIYEREVDFTLKRDKSFNFMETNKD